MTKTFDEKRILFFAPKFFGYEHEIADGMRKLGAEVDLYDERPGNGFFTKALIRIHRSLLAVRIASYYNKIIETTKNRDYDFIVFIKGEAVSEANIGQMRKYHPHAKFVLYFWDSLKNNRNGRKLMPLFDRVLSFDRIDCAAEKHMVHRPLFYLDAYRDASIIQERDNDLLFIGTVHSDRFAFAKKVKDLCRKAGLRTKFIFFFQSPPLYVVRRLVDKSFRGTKISDFRFRALKRDNITALVSRSTAVLDVQHPNQKGLTMRTIEVFGAHRKLVTTNREIIEYDFYRPANVLIVDRDNPLVDIKFFTTPYEPCPDELYCKYSLERWIKDVLGTDAD
jgi:hypothetical protein